MSTVPFTDKAYLIAAILCHIDGDLKHLRELQIADGVGQSYRGHRLAGEIAALNSVYQFVRNLGESK